MTAHLTSRILRAGHLAALLIACAVAGFAAPAAAEYPDHPIRLIVPQAAGSATDTLARLVAATAGPELGQNIVVDDRPGGALTLGLDLLAKSPPDGYTIGMGPIGALAITRHMLTKLPYNIERDFQPVCLVTRGHLMLAISPSLPVRSVKELIAYAKAHPGELNNASSSIGSPGHVGAELFKYMTDTKITHVPYKGGADAIKDLIGGRVQIMFESLNSISPFARSGQVRALGVTGAKRSAAFPDIPTIAEAGVPGYEAGTWSGVIAPAGIPKPVLDKLNAAINRGLKSKLFTDKLAGIGDEAAGGTPEEFAQTIARDSAKWREVVQRIGLKLGQ